MTVENQEHTAFYDALAGYDVWPLWMQKGLLANEPKSAALPHVWRYEPLRELLLEAGGLITAEAAERRVLMLNNPGLGGRPGVTPRLYAGLQLVLPGESAPVHRHMASALRMIVEGSGSHTSVDGEKTIMHPGDLVLTPNWTWHGHANDTDEPVIWLDGLDLPLVQSLELMFFDNEGRDDYKLTAPVDWSVRTMGVSRMTPRWKDWDQPYSPIVRYPWRDTERALLEAAAVDEGSPYDGVIYEYTNPYTGGPVMPTLGCYAQLLRPGQRTRAHRHTTSAVYHVVRGHGESIIDGQLVEWAEKDTFALPAWAAHEHRNVDADAPAMLFSFTDDPVLRPLGYYRHRAEPSAA